VKASRSSHSRRCGARRMQSSPPTEAGQPDRQEPTVKSSASDTSIRIHRRRFAHAKHDPHRCHPRRAGPGARSRVGHVRVAPDAMGPGPPQPHVQPSPSCRLPAKGARQGPVSPGNYHVGSLGLGEHCGRREKEVRMNKVVRTQKRILGIKKTEYGSLPRQEDRNVGKPPPCGRRDDPGSDPPIGRCRQAGWSSGRKS